MTANILILFASQTGSAEAVAEEVHEALTDASLPAKLHDLSLNEELEALSSASCILGVVSTWGDGEPPDDAVPFFDNLREADSLQLGGKPIAVLGLGDSGYEYFCACGKELEQELLRHGGRAILPRVDCDVWYEEDTEKWFADLLDILPPLIKEHEAKISI